MSFYNSGKIKDLIDQKKAINALNIALTQKDKSGFLLELYNIAIAQGMSKIAELSGLNREGLYKTLQPLGNPSIKTLIAILEAMNLELQVHSITLNSKTASLKIERRNSIAHAHPALAAQWHPQKNAPLSTQDILITSRKSVWWVCHKNIFHEWKETILSRTNKFKKNFLNSTNFTEKTFATQLQQGCPYCARNNE